MTVIYTCAGPMVEMEQDDNKGPSAPSGPKGGTTSRRSSVSDESLHNVHFHAATSGFPHFLEW